MTFNEAYTYAMQYDRFARHDAIVKKAEKSGEPTICLLFSIGEDAFSYGFDGECVIKTKHTKSRSKYLINNGCTYEI